MKRTLIDLGERVGATFAQAFLAAITLGTTLDIGAAKIGAVAGAYAVAKYLLVAANHYLRQPPPDPPPAE